MGKYLPILLAAQYGSLNKAASLLGYAQPSMMYIINKMEDELGVKLFYRTKRGVTPTPAGSKLLEVMAEIEEQEANIRHIAQSYQEDQLRIGTFPGMPGRWISGLLAAMGKEKPDTRVMLETFSRYQDGLEAVKRSTLSCSFSAIADPSGVDALPLRDDPYFLVLAADHPLARYESLSLAEVLGTVPLIQNPESYDPGGVLWEFYQKTENVFLADSTPPDYIFSLSLTEQGLGATLLPGLLLDEFPQRDALRFLPLTDGPRRTLTLLCPKKADRSAAVNDFIDLVERFVKETAAQ